jgi:hypothetical protein
MSASDYNDGQAQETKGCRDRSRNTQVDAHVDIVP